MLRIVLRETCRRLNLNLYTQNLKDWLSSNDFFRSTEILPSMFKFCFQSYNYSYNSDFDYYLGICIFVKLPFQPFQISSSLRALITPLSSTFRHILKIVFVSKNLKWHPTVFSWVCMVGVTLLFEINSVFVLGKFVFLDY